jgi:OOP family OmpA-OmpF porin
MPDPSSPTDPSPAAALRSGPERGVRAETMAAQAAQLEGGPERDAYGALRELLLAPEQREIEELKHQLAQNNAPVAVDSVAAVLPAAVTRAHEQGGRMAGALQPLLEGTLLRAVRERPAVIAEAIFPIIGAAINRAMREALSRMMQQTTYALEHAFSLRSWRWRLEARATGQPFSEVVLLHSLVFRVEQVFLIQPESGLLLQHVHADMQQASVEESMELQNASLVSSMLTAIQDFVRDSFRTDSKAALDTVEVGEVTVWIERGTAPVSLRSVLREALAKCHRDYPAELKAFSGDPNELSGLRPYLLQCLQSQQQSAASRPLLGRVVLSALLLAALGGLGYLSLREWQREQQHLRAHRKLAQQPGYILLRSQRRGTGYDLELLRDPQAKPVEEALSEAGFRAGAGSLVVRPFLSLEPALIQARATAALRPPESVSLQLRPDGTLVASGKADADWIADARLLGPTLAGIAAFVCEVTPLPQPPQLYDILMERAHALEAIVFHFRAGSIELIPGQAAEQARAVAEMKEILRMAAGDPSLDVTIEVYAHTDSIGDELYNLRLRESRAKQMRYWLASAGIDMRKLRAVAPLQFEIERQERAASFRVVVTETAHGKKRSR